ncbi:hypothetical protein RR48_12405 [Papilio machaon]|uniref:Uncharacterized protein n=1 Tax=Papilio machaon TaxID=76193 RepID=A0A194RNA1_PAPMA|nr:hypothetical protein RR48_12405 [Papilio machaon]
MNEVYRSDYGNKINEGSSNANYDDDGFFSDVPISGSLSKSLLALNKYVKKNLLYDDSEEANDDSAYFSKETSPNESTLKSDSDSGKSMESPDKYIVSTPLTDADVVLNIIKVQTITEMPIATEIKHTEQLTDDYKFQKLYENSTNNLTVLEKQIDEPSQQVTVPTEEIQEITQQENHSTSLDDLNTITKTKEYTENTGEVKLRNKLITENADTKRHTIHDVSEWVNRANIYPDVYAPLPYNKVYFKLFVEKSRAKYLWHAQYEVALREACRECLYLVKVG